MFSIVNLPHQAPPLPFYLDCLRNPGLGSRELHLGFLYASLQHHVPSTRLSFLVCELKIIIATSQAFSEDLMNVESLCFFVFRFFLLECFFKKCYANIKYQVLFFFLHPDSYSKFYTLVLFPLCAFFYFPIFSGKPSPSPSTDSSFLEAKYSDRIFIDVKALRDRLFKSPPFEDEKTKVQGVIIPTLTNSRSEIS